MRILLADDESKVCMALRLLLENELAIEVSATAADVEELHQAIAGPVPDLILLDWELPALDARHFLSLLHARSPRASVIAMSSRPEARQAASAAGVDGFISKGEPAEQVLAVVSRVLDQQVATSAARL